MIHVGTMRDRKILMPIGTLQKSLGLLDDHRPIEMWMGWAFLDRAS